jgi:DNA-binding transcriptional ArsR family regulator
LLTVTATDRARDTGDADLAAVGTLLAEPARARILLALADGRALPASVLAAEAGVARSTASAHLGRLLDGGLLAVVQQGRHRYYRLSGPEVGELIEVLARLAPPQPVRSLREGSNAHAMRSARTCYDHLAGRLGVELFAAMIARGWVTGGDGRHRVEAGGRDRLAARGHDVNYTLTPAGRSGLAGIGVELTQTGEDGPLPLRYCVDWTEQRHHLSGTAGRTLTQRLLELRWLLRLPRSRAVTVTPAGREGLRAVFGLEP